MRTLETMKAVGKKLLRVSISEEAYKKLQTIARVRNQSPAKVLEAAIDLYASYQAGMLD